MVTIGLILIIFSDKIDLRIAWFYFPLSTFVSCRRRTGTAELCLTAAALYGELCLIRGLN